MDKNDYLFGIIQNIAVNAGSKAMRQLNHFKPIIAAWGGEYLSNAFMIGSTVQDTNIKGEYDLDLDILVSLNPDVPHNLPFLHDSLKKYLTKAGHKVKTRNISMNTIYNNVSVDFVVATRHAGTKGTKQGFHDVYSTKKKKVMPSSPQLHIELVRKSGKKDVIKLVKRWIVCHKLDFPSLYAMLVVLESTKNLTMDDGLYTNFRTVLEYLSKKFLYVKVADPANKADLVSEQISDKERFKIAKYAENCLKQANLSEVVW